MTPEEQEQELARRTQLGPSQALDASVATGALTPQQISQRSNGANQLRNAQQGVITADGEAYNERMAGASGEANGINAGIALDASRDAAGTAQSNTQATQINNNTGSNANFALNGQQTGARQDADTALRAANAYHDKILSDSAGGIPDVGRLVEAGDMIAKAQRGADVADLNAQSTNGGVQRTDQEGVAPGIAGLFGGTKAQSNFTAGPVDTSATNKTGARIDALGASIGARPMTQAKAATSTAASLDQTASNQVRNQQQGLAGMLDASARGVGPSAAQAQLQAGTDASISSALALAHSQRGGNQSAALKQALMQNGTAMQQAANSSAQLKAQEQQHAQEALGGVLSGVRGQDLGAATTNAGYQQQTSIANAGNNQQTNLANLTASVDQQKEKDAMQAQLLQQVQAGQITQMQAQQQMAQFNADLLARQEAARNGQTIAAGNAQTQAIGTGVAAAGSVLAAALA